MQYFHTTCDFESGKNVILDQPDTLGVPQCDNWKICLQHEGSYAGGILFPQGFPDCGLPPLQIQSYHL